MGLFLQGNENSDRCSLIFQEKLANSMLVRLRWVYEGELYVIEGGKDADDLRPRGGVSRRVAGLNRVSSSPPGQSHQNL